MVKKEDIKIPGIGFRAHVPISQLVQPLGATDETTLKRELIDKRVNLYKHDGVWCVNKSDAQNLMSETRNKISYQQRLVEKKEQAGRENTGGMGPT